MNALNTKPKIPPIAIKITVQSSISSLGNSTGDKKVEFGVCKVGEPEEWTMLGLAVGGDVGGKERGEGASLGERLGDAVDGAPLGE